MSKFILLVKFTNKLMQKLAESMRQTQVVINFAKAKEDKVGLNLVDFYGAWYEKFQC